MILLSLTAQTSNFWAAGLWEQTQVSAEHTVVCLSFSFNEIEKAKSLQFKINECIFDLLSCKSLYGVAKQVMSIRFGIECGNPRSPFLPVKREDAQPIADKINKYVSEIK